VNAPETLRVISTDPATQGPFVIINAADFDPARHELFDTPPAAAPEVKRGPGRPRKQTGAPDADR
jgi:hypothetical protein